MAAYHWVDDLLIHWNQLRAQRVWEAFTFLLVFDINSATGSHPVTPEGGDVIASGASKQVTIKCFSARMKTHVMLIIVCLYRTSCTLFSCTTLDWTSEQPHTFSALRRYLEFIVQLGSRSHKFVQDSLNP